MTSTDPAPMARPGPVDRIAHVLAQFLGVIATSSIIVLMIAITIDVIVRNISGGSLPGMFELAESSLVVAVFFGLAWGAIKGEHVSVRLLSDRLGPAANRVFDIIGWAVSSVFLAWITWASYIKAQSSTELGEFRFGLLNWPVYPWRWVIVVGFAVLTLVAIMNVARALLGKEIYGVTSLEEEIAAYEPDIEVAHVAGSYPESDADAVTDAEPDADEQTGRDS